MNYHKIDKCSISNGIGIRTVLWVSGCDHHCKGCHNPETWDCNSGKPFDESAKAELFENLSKPYIDGITYSGGDPLHWANYSDIISLAKEIRERFPDKTQWLYTGYTFECLTQYNDSRDNIFDYIDVLVDGEYVEEARDITLPFRGSSNQRLIDVDKSKQVGLSKPILWGDYK